jgi:ElaB/YqjD/DUF883 family membrane-anchored ribosome-binding protein
MDKRTEPIEQDIAAIRDSMTEKMGQIEHRIRSSVEETGDSLKRTVDLRYQVEEHPWAMVGAAVLFGYAVGSLSGSSEPEPHTAVRAPERNTKDLNTAEWHQTISGSNTSPSQASTSFLDEMKEQFSDELDLVKTVAISSAVAFLRDVIKDSLPGLAGELERTRRAQGGVVHSAPAAPTSPNGGLRRSTSFGEEPIVNNELIPTSSTNY